MPPRLHFAHLPTPIEPLPRLSAMLGGPSLFIKRDDQTGLALGGNKTRKLEFLVADALEQGADLLITAGAIQSNHCRQTAAIAARLGLECTLVLTGEPPDHPSANLLLDRLFNAHILYVPDRRDRERVLQETADRARSQGRRPYLVPYGGSSPTGVLGYVFAIQEVLEQWPALGAEAQPDWIICATSSGGTQAGMVLGCRHFGFTGRILGISIDESVSWLQRTISTLATQASALLGEPMEITPDEVLANDDYCRAGYGVLTEADREAIHLFARTEGILLDPVYTGRAAAGMIDLIRRGFFRKDEAVLFWHTGGQPALFADRYAQAILPEGR